MLGSEYFQIIEEALKAYKKMIVEKEIYDNVNRKLCRYISRVEKAVHIALKEIKEVRMRMKDFAVEHPKDIAIENDV